MPRASAASGGGRPCASVRSARAPCMRSSNPSLPTRWRQWPTRVRTAAPRRSRGGAGIRRNRSRAPWKRGPAAAPSLEECAILPAEDQLPANRSAIRAGPRPRISGLAPASRPRVTRTSAEAERIAGAGSADEPEASSSARRPAGRRVRRSPPAAPHRQRRRRARAPPRSAPTVAAARHTLITHTNSRAAPTVGVGSQDRRRPGRPPELRSRHAGDLAASRAIDRAACAWSGRRRRPVLLVGAIAVPATPRSASVSPVTRVSASATRRGASRRYPPPRRVPPAIETRRANRGTPRCAGRWARCRRAGPAARSSRRRGSAWRPGSRCALGRCRH